jgi:predicted nucleotidyltransferase
VDIIENRKRQREQVIGHVSDFINGLNFKCTALLIGSYARGDFNLWSDVDLLIIGEFNGTPLERLKNFNLPPGYEAILLTPDKVAKRMKMNERFISDSFENGVIIKDHLHLVS